MTRRRRGWVWWALAAAFVLVPILEIWLLIQLGQAIGPWWTILVLIADGILGSYLVKREGGRAWRGLQEALTARRMPATELADGALILIGGTLLLTPGFATDVVGLFCVLPFTRPLARRALARVLTRRLTATSRGPHRSSYRPGGAPPPGAAAGPTVVPGEVVDP